VGKTDRRRPGSRVASVALLCVRHDDSDLPPAVTHEPGSGHTRTVHNGQNHMRTVTVDSVVDHLLLSTGMPRRQF
jgi:hypothetical protein